MSDVKKRIVMCVDLDYFYAQAEEVRNPSLKRKPLVVCVFSGRTEDSGAVSTSNYLARTLGVRSGIPIVQAKKILSSHPEAVFLPMDRDYYDLTSERVMNILRSHSSSFEQASIDEAYLDISLETNGDYAKALQIGEKIKREISVDEQLTCTIGLGPNKLISKMAVDAKKPDGLNVIRPNEIRSYLDPLPIGKLFGIGPKMEKKLQALNIATVAQLAAADLDLLSRNFGEKLGPQLKSNALGIDDDPVNEREVEQFSRIVTLKENAVSYDFQDVLAPLVKDLGMKLVSANLICESIGIIAITSQLKTKTRSRKIEPPTDSEHVILEVVSDLFRAFFAEEKLELHGISIRRVGIRVSNFAKKLSEGKEKNLTDFF